jgi:hypothetical protein
MPGRDEGSKCREILMKINNHNISQEQNNTEKNKETPENWFTTARHETTNDREPEKTRAISTKG